MIALQDIKWESLRAKLANERWYAPQEEQPPFQVEDYIVRIEWQKRGMPHAHMLLWSKDAAPRVHGQNAESTEEYPEPHNFGDDEDMSDHDAVPRPRTLTSVLTATPIMIHRQHYD